MLNIWITLGNSRRLNICLDGVIITSTLSTRSLIRGTKTNMSFPLFCSSLRSTARVHSFGQLEQEVAQQNLMKAHSSCNSLQRFAMSRSLRAALKARPAALRLLVWKRRWRCSAVSLQPLPWSTPLSLTPSPSPPAMQQPCRAEMKALCCCTPFPCLHLLSIPPSPAQHQGHRREEGGEEERRR